MAVFFSIDLKIIAGLSIQPMVKIFNEVLDKGEFPKTWLVAKVLFPSQEWQLERELANSNLMHLGNMKVFSTLGLNEGIKEC